MWYKNIKSLESWKKSNAEFENVRDMFFDVVYEENQEKQDENIKVEKQNSEIIENKEQIIEAQHKTENPPISAKIDFYYHPISPPSRAVLFVLKHLNIEHELHELDMVSKEHKQAWYLRMNPNGQVPCLKHQNLAIFESRSIMSYLVNAFSDNLPQKVRLGKARVVNRGNMWYSGSALFFCT